MRPDKLPIFTKWGEKMLARKRTIIVVLLVLVAHAAIRGYLKDYYAVIQPCDQPCQDGISCDPLELSFEVIPNNLRESNLESLWYRATIKNRSCREITPISVEGLLDSTELQEIAGPFSITIRDASGRELERLPPPGSDGGIAWDFGSAKGVDISTQGTIHPYQPNFELIKQLRDSGKLSKLNYVSLNPGESFESITSLLRPYRIVATSARTEDGGFAHGYRWVRVENPPEFPMPPKGFIFLDRYKFPRPGRYTVTASYRGEVSLYPIFKRWEDRSRWLDLIFWGTYPSRLNSKRRNVKVLAPAVSIEVVR